MRGTRGSRLLLQAHSRHTRVSHARHAAHRGSPTRAHAHTSNASCAGQRLHTPSCKDCARHARGVRDDVRRQPIWRGGTRQSAGAERPLQTCLRAAGGLNCRSNRRPRAQRDDTHPREVHIPRTVAACHPPRLVRPSLCRAPIVRLCADCCALRWSHDSLHASGVNLESLSTCKCETRTRQPLCALLAYTGLTCHGCGQHCAAELQRV